MSELKTFRCDICKQIYHSDEVRGTLTIKYECDDDRLNGEYKHICPHCAGVIGKLLPNPTLLEQLTVEKERATNYACNLEHIIKTIRDTVCGWHSWPMFHFSDDAIQALDHWKGVAKEIKTKYAETKNSMLKWRLSTIALIGTIVGNILYVIIK